MFRTQNVNPERITKNLERRTHQNPERFRSEKYSTSVLSMRIRQMLHVYDETHVFYIVNHQQLTCSHVRASSWSITYGYYIDECKNNSYFPWRRSQRNKYLKKRGIAGTTHYINYNELQFIHYNKL